MRLVAIDFASGKTTGKIGAMRAAAFRCAAFAVLMSGPAYAACTKPAIPACANEKGGFSSAANFDACRLQMLPYKDAMEKHAACAK